MHVQLVVLRLPIGLLRLVIIFLSLSRAAILGAVLTFAIFDWTVFTVILQTLRARRILSDLFGLRLLK